MDDYSVASPSHLSPDERMTGDMVNENYEPDAAEDAVIDVLRRERRANPYLIREATDELSRQQINAALSNLCAAGWCRKVTRGLYEYVEDPRVGTSDATDSQPNTSESDGVVSPARDALADWQPRDVDTDRARDATLAVVDWLAREGEPRQKSAILEWCAGEDVSEYAESTLWAKAVKPGLSELRAAGVVKQRRNVGWWVVEDGDGD